MSGIFGGGSSTTVVQNTTPAPSAQELELIALNRDLAQRQLANVDALQPFQQELLGLAIEDLRRTGADSRAMDAALTPEQRASFAKQEFERAQKLGPVQDELLQLQLDQLRRGGAATPEQIKLIKEATDAGIMAGSADIDQSTQRGIGLISDELANSRGLRMTDTPIAREATLLARSGEDQKASLTKNLRAAEMQSRLNFPLAVQQLQSGINLSQQNLFQNTQQFQADLRQRAFQNRLALTGQASGTGIGLAGIGAGNGALDALTRTRLASGSSTSTGSRGVGLGEVGQLASGLGALAAFSDRRLKVDYGTVGETRDGVPLHVYRYKGEDASDPLRLGVMADEVEQVNPRAVRTHRSGYKVVDYAAVR